MKKNMASRKDPDMLDEYDFSDGVRGKYAHRYREGTNIIRLDEDVAEKFPNSEKVNKALRNIGRYMANKKVTGRRAASAASRTLRSKSTSNKSKTAAGSALSQRKAPKRQTSTKAATASSKTLSHGRTSKSSKSAAGSALVQARKKKR